VASSEAPSALISYACMPRERARSRCPWHPRRMPRRATPESPAAPPGSTTPCGRSVPQPCGHPGSATLDRLPLPLLAAPSQHW